VRIAFATALGAAALSLVGCKKDSSAETEASIAKLGEFRDQVCACTDKACADRVTADLTAYGEERARAKTARTTPEQRKKMLEISQAYGACMSKLSTPAPEAPVDAAVADAPPEKPDVPPRPANPNDATRVMRDAAMWARENYHSAIGSIEIEYVDAEGMLDPEYGEIEIHFGFDRSDDPKRRTGAPVKEPTFANQCFGLKMSKGLWQRRDDISCGKTYRAPTCSIQHVWKKALEVKAPADAIAKIHLTDTNGKPAWFFRITDTTRNVDFMHLVPDDCPIEVEK
jgi:hypothetical protein